MPEDRSPHTQLFTLGHSAHPIAKIIRLLQAAGVEILVDVRSMPYSRFHPQFNKARLEASLADAGIRYHWLGEALGGRPADPTCYPPDQYPPRKGEPHPRPIWERVMEKPWFQAGIDRLLDIAAEGRTAILCSEENPANCHRRLLIAEYLNRTHPEITVIHLRGDGSRELPAGGR